MRSPNSRAQLLERGVGVLDGVVQQRRGEHLDVGDAALARQHLGERDRMVDVGRGLGVLAPLVAVLVRGERERPEQQCQILFRLAFHSDCFCKKLSTIRIAAPTVIAESATLNAGQCQPAAWKSRKSTTWP